MTTVKASGQLTLRDRLSRLTFEKACKLLGPFGKKLITQGGHWEINLEDQVYLGDDLFRLTLRSHSGETEAIVTITLMADVRDRLHWHCGCCNEACEHVGAAFSLILEAKTPLGLAEPPKERVPVESLSEEALVELALNERKERAKSEKMKIVAAEPDQPWTDYTVTSLLSGKSYRVALRGLDRGSSYCSCPDFRTNTLGTCKHILNVQAKVKKKSDPAALKKPYRRKRIAVHLHYDHDVTLRLAIPIRLKDEVTAAVKPLLGRPITDVQDLLKRLAKLEQLDQDFHVYPDAEEHIQNQLARERLQTRMAEIRRDATRNPLRQSLLKIPLLPYQLDGVAFAAHAGRAVLADDMGLGKTIQGVGLAELLAREVGIRKVLVVCPASVKSQWKNEISRFCDRETQVVMGPNAQRLRHYSNDSFFTICNYEQVLRDILDVEQVKWDLIILDEGQRIKNWESKTARVIKGLRSQFALVLSGTPLENRLDDLYSVVQFIDQRRLGPGFRFFNQHRVVDEKGKVLGYKNLEQLRENLRPILLRRTRDSVKLELPPRTTEIVRITPTDEQLSVHHANMQVVASIVRKKFISEMDLLRLRMALLAARMSADSTFLNNKEPPGHSSKLERLAELFDELFDEQGRKVVLFSEWTTMLDLIEPLLKKRKLPYVRLDGSVPQKQRQELVHEFQTNPDCKLFITTNAGSVGLNLQAANTVINVDLPWNPAVLEQRIGRAHRMGQTQPVQVYVLVTEGTIEENLLQTLSAKKDLALAALDPEATVDTVDMASGMDQLKSRLEVLLGAKPIAPLDETMKRDAEAPTREAAERRERVAAAGGEMLGAAFKFLGELVASQAEKPAEPAVAADLRNRLAECVEDDASGRPRLTVTLPDRAALNQLADALAQLLAVGK
ncbi:MAG TPA: DEAD/DEAH box helicase [Pirellulaceae bacterium]|jgi:superfamily II DNA or RNA helicase